MQKLGGLTVVIRKLNHSDLEMRTSSAWVLGKACQNNPVVQKQVSVHFSVLCEIFLCIGCSAKNILFDVRIAVTATWCLDKADEDGKV